MSKPEVTEIATVPGGKPSFKTRLAAHYKRFWWAHLIGLVVVVLVVALPVVYVGYPNIAQGDINDSTLTVKEMVISDPTPDSFQLSQKQVIGTDSAFHPDIFAFDAVVGLAGGDSSFATVRVPGIKTHDGVEVNVEQRVDLSDAGSFGDFATAVMLNEEIGLNVYGKPQLKLGALPTITVDYNKTATMKGLNKLSGFELLSMRLVKDGPGGTNSVGRVLIPNPSVMTIAMGNLTLDLTANGTAIGQSFLNNLVLKPGNNEIDMTANVTQTKLFPLVAAYEDEGYIVPVEITGNSSVYNGQHLPYFEKALSANKLHVNLNISQILGDSV